MKLERKMCVRVCSFYLKFKATQYNGVFFVVCSFLRDFFLVSFERFVYPKDDQLMRMMRTNIIFIHKKMIKCSSFDFVNAVVVMMMVFYEWNLTTYERWTPFSTRSMHRAMHLVIEQIASHCVYSFISHINLAIVTKFHITRRCRQFL